jgi:hypothetical protein
MQSVSLSASLFSITRCAKRPKLRLDGHEERLIKCSSTTQIPNAPPLYGRRIEPSELENQEQAGSKFSLSQALVIRNLFHQAKLLTSSTTRSFRNV